MRVLLALLLIGIVGCGGEETLPGDAATPSSPAIFPVKSENAAAGAPKTKADELPAQAADEQKPTAKKSVESRETLTLKGHSDIVASVSFSPDGKRIVSGDGGLEGGEIKVWDAQTGQEMLALKGHSEIVTSVSFSPDGKRIVGGGDDSTLKVWDISSLDTSK